MKRFDSSHSLGALISISQPKGTHDDEEEEKFSESNRGYSKEFQAMLDNLEREDCGEELMGPGKKRRLRSEQVKALERYFEVENKLEPERKVKLADELGLQPRQVAIWFQNRRARWKTKQLERDFGLLESNYNSLKLSFQDLQQENQALTIKVRQLKEKVSRVESHEEISNESVKEASPASENNNEIISTVLDLRKKDIDSDDDDDNGNDEQQMMIESRLISDEDSNLKFSLGLNGSSSSSSSCSNNNNNSLMPINWPFRLSESSRTVPAKTYQTRVEEVQFMANHMSPFGSDEPSCNNFFSVDQAPTLYWYLPDQSN